MKGNLKSRMLAIILIVIIFIGPFFQIKVQATSEPPEDLEDDTLPGVIAIDSQLDLILMQNSDQHFILTEDIEITGNLNPISNFEGIFDGSGHSITYNIQENTGPFPSTQYLGLFASCSEATIKNLYVNGNISLTTGSSMSNPNVYVGGIVAFSENSTLENVHFSGNINIVTSNDNSSWVGGLVGKASNTTISLSDNTASITAEVESIIGITRTGGLCGEFDGTIEDCYNTGNVLAMTANGSPYAGGLVANNKGTITQSYNSGKVQSKGTSTSLSDVYAGGIAAVGESNSSITKCAVMSPEISITKGWVNNGYKYIIAKGSSKSDNISINSITGSPTNDSNARYTQAELKTTTPYDLSFYNTWAIDETINNGYPFFDRNVYASKYISYQLVPEDLKSFIDDGYINTQDLMQTDDGFTLCTKPLDEIFESMNINEINGEEDSITSEDIDSWYIYAVGNTYSILKMRGLEERAIGTSIPFMSFDLDLIKLFHEDLIQQVQHSENEIQLYNKLYSLMYGEVSPLYLYDSTIVDYFSSTTSRGNYLIAEEYIRKVLTTERDSEGYIQVPNNIGLTQQTFLSSLPNIYDSTNNRIKVNRYNLTIDEKHAILASRVGDLSFNIYAAENIAHAMATEKLGNFLQGTELMLIFEVIDPDSHEATVLQVGRDIAKDWFASAIKADAGIGEESIPKELIPYYILESQLVSAFGDI